MANDFAFLGSLKLLPIDAANIAVIKKQLESLGTIKTKAVSKDVSKSGSTISKSIKKDLSLSSKEFDNFGQLVAKKSKDVIKGFEGIGSIAGKTAQDIKKLSNQPVISNKQISGIKKGASSIKKVRDNTKDAYQNMRQLGIESASTFRKFGLFTVAIGIFRSLTSSIRRTIEASFELERSFIKIGQVSNKSFKQTKRLRDEILDLSASYGTAATDISDVALTLTQAGLASNEVSIALKSIVATDLSPTFTSISDTGEAAIAIMNQFGTSVEDLEGQFDAINSVSANFAVESDNIVSAVRRAGSVFESAGGNLNELIALYTAIRSSSREAPESIATGLKTITARIQKSANVKKIKEALGIDLRDNAGNFIGPLEAFKQISKALENVDKNSDVFFKVAEALGGLRQIARITPLIKNFDVVQKALNVTMNSSGSVYEDVSQAQESLVVQFNKLRAELSKLITQITQDDSLRELAFAFINVATAITKAANAIKPFAAILSGLAVAKGIRVLGPYFGGLKRGFTGRNKGGFIPGRGPNKDTVPAMLTKGEFVMQRSAVDRIGVNRLTSMNRGYNSGGLVQGFSSGGLAIPTKTLGGIGIAAAVLGFNALKGETDEASDSLGKFSIALGAASIQLLAGFNVLGLAKSQFTKVGKIQFSGATIRDIRGRVKARVANRRIKRPSAVDSYLDSGSQSRYLRSLQPIPGVDRRSGFRRFADKIPGAARVNSFGSGISSFAKPVLSKVAAPLAKVGGVISKLGSIPVLLAGLADTAARSLAPDSVYDNGLGIATKGISGAATGAFIGSFLAPFTAGLSVPIGAIGGGLINAATESETVASTMRFLSLGMIDFDSKLERVTKRSLKKNADAFDELSKKLREDVNVKNFGNVLDNNTGLRNIVETGDKDSAKIAKSRLDDRSKLVTDSFNELLSKGDPSKLIKSLSKTQKDELVSAYQASGDSLFLILQDAKKNFNDLKKATIALNKSNFQYISAMQQRIVVEKAVNSATAASEPFNRAAQSIQGNLSQGDVTRLFARGKSGTLDDKGSADLDKLIQMFSKLGQGRNGQPTGYIIAQSESGKDKTAGSVNSVLSGNAEIAQRASDQASIISVLPKAIAEAVKLGGDDTGGLISLKVKELLGKRGNNISKSTEFKRLDNIINDISEIGDDLKGFNKGDIDSIISKFKSGALDLDTISNVYKAIQVNNQKLQSALSVRVALEETLNSSLSKLTDIIFQAEDDFAQFGTSKKLDTVATANNRQNVRIKDILRGQGLSGANTSQLRDVIIRSREEQQSISKQGLQSSFDVEKFTALQTKITSVTRALEFMRDTTDKANAIRTKLNEIEARQSAGRDIAERFATGTNQEKLNIKKDLENAVKLLNGVSLNSIKQDERSRALATVSSLRGEDAKNKIVANSLDPSFQPTFKAAGQTKEGKPLFQQLQQTNQQKLQAGADLAAANKDAVKTQQENINLLIISFEQTLTKILKENASAPQNVKHTGKFEHIVKVKIEGDKVFNELGPGIKKLVANTVNKAILDIEKSNPGIEVPTIIGLGV